MTTHTIQPDPMTVEIERHEGFTGHRFLGVAVRLGSGHAVCFCTIHEDEEPPHLPRLTLNERGKLCELIAQEWEAWK